MATEQKTNTMNIYQRLHAVMKAVSYVSKEGKKVNNQYTFVSHDAVTAAIRPHLIDNGVLCFPQELKTQQNGNRTEAYFNLRFVNIDSPDDFIDIPTFGYGIDQQDKGVGKAMSYGVKYGILKALNLETGDDPERDNINHKPEPKKTEEPKKVPELTPEQKETEARKWSTKSETTMLSFTDLQELYDWEAKNKKGIDSLKSYPEINKKFGETYDKVLNTLSQAPIAEAAE